MITWRILKHTGSRVTFRIWWYWQLLFVVYLGKMHLTSFNLNNLSYCNTFSITNSTIINAHSNLKLMNNLLAFPGFEKYWPDAKYCFFLINYPQVYFKLRLDEFALIWLWQFLLAWITTYRYYWIYSINAWGLPYLQLHIRDLAFILFKAKSSHDK